MGVRKIENSGSCTHLGFFDNLDDLDGVLDADFGAIASCNKYFDRMEDGSIERIRVQRLTAADAL